MKDKEKPLSRTLEEHMEGIAAQMERIIKAFDHAAPSYENWYTTPLGTYVLDSETNALGQLLPRRGLGVEIGAGTGIFSRRLSTNERRITCIEPSIDMTVELAKKPIQTVIGLAEKPPLRASCLDFAYLVTVVEFLEEPARAFRSIRNLLRRKATLVVLAINRKSPWGELYQEAATRTDSVFRFSTLYTPPELTHMLKESGYSVSQCLMTLETAPESYSTLEPKTYPCEALPDGGVFVLQAIPAEEQKRTK